MSGSNFRSMGDLVLKGMGIVFVFVVLAGTALAQEQSLFNGKDLAGWDGEPGWWSVEDGAITSESTPEKSCRKATYLVWTGGEPADFELTLDFKLSPLSPKANSGVQIRSERRPDWDTFGYQADMDAVGGLVGYVYHHGRGLIAARGEKVHIAADGQREAALLGDAEKLKAEFKPGEWNHYRIVCNGPDITLYVNDVLMCEFSDRDAVKARSSGIIALQMHPGPPMKVQFKNIILKPMEGQETSLIHVLQSGADDQEKADACRELGQVGTAAAVPVLAGLLSDQHLSHLARQALQIIPDPAADDALRSALASLTGEHLAGVIATIGSRRDRQSVALLAELLKRDDTVVANAAAAALGRIGTREAAGALQKALEGEGTADVAALCDAILDCADTFCAGGSREEALILYRALQVFPDVPVSVQEAGLRGEILNGGDEGLSLMVESITGGDAGAADAAARAALELKHAGASARLTAALNDLPLGRQILVTGLLGNLGYADALPALLHAMTAGEAPLRLAAIRAVGEIGGMQAVNPLVERLDDPDPAVAQAAEETLAGLYGPDVDRILVEMLGSPDRAIQPGLIEIVADRRAMDAKPVLAGLMKAEGDVVRLAAIKSFGRLAGIEDVPFLLDVIQSSAQPGDITELGRAIMDACRNGGEETCAQLVVVSLEKATAEARPMLEKILARVDVPEDLGAEGQ